MAEVKSDYITKERLTDICDHLAEGLSVRSYDFAAHGLTRKSFYIWLSEHATTEDRDQYARAMSEDRPAAIFEEILEIADNASDDLIFIAEKGEDGESAKPAINHSVINRARLQIDARKWCLGRMNPKKYGDKITNEHTGPDGGAIKYDGLPESEINARINELLNKAGSS